MSNSFSFGRAAKIGVLAIAMAAAGCTTYGGGPSAGPYGTPVRAAGTVPYVPPRAEPASCRSLRRFDEQLALQSARGNTRITQGIIGAVTGGLLGNKNTRDAGIGAVAGAVGAEVYTSYEQRQARAQLANQCNADIAALQQGVCSWNSRTGETTKVVNGRPVAVFQGDATRSTECQGVGGPVDSYRPPID